MSSAKLAATPFFGHFLTIRHLLTRRHPAAVALLMAGLVVPTGYWLGTQAKSSDPSVIPVASGSSSAPSRPLRVSTRELKSAGPSFLLQRYTGIVAARRASQLSSKDVARVEKVLVDIGDQVEEGQLLIGLDAAQLRAQRQVAEANLAAAKAQLDELTRGPRTQDIEQAEAAVAELEANLKLYRANLDRLTDLRRTSAISKQEYDESRYAVDAMAAKLDSASQNLERLLEGSRREQIEAQTAVVAGLEAQLQRIHADLADRNILAPFSGSIQARLIDEGSVVSPGQALLEIVEGTPYEIRVGLPPEIVQHIAASALQVKTGDRPLDATISRIAPSINQQTRTREVVLKLSETASQFVSIGSAVDVSVQVPVFSTGYWVPSVCLTAGPRGLWAVYVATNAPEAGVGDGLGQIERRQVELLRAQGDWSEIQGPLSPTDRLVVEGVHRTAPGQLVQVVRLNDAT